MKNFVPVVLFMLFLSLITLNAQTSLDKKLKDVKGKVQKITIKTDSGEYVFDGDDAAKLAKRLHGKKEIKKIVVKADEDTLDIDIPDLRDCPGLGKLFDCDSTSKHFEINCDIDSMVQKMKKKFHKFFDENTVTIITDEDGKETVETFTGKDADKKIEEIKKSDDENGTTKKHIKKTVIIKKNDAETDKTQTK